MATLRDQKDIRHFQKPKRRDDYLGPRFNFVQ
jgi:hypothetical protein